MGVVGGRFGLWFLRRIAPAPPNTMDGRAFRGDTTKLKLLLGDEVFQESRSRVVLDFGCGEGTEVIELALAGAKQVIGIDVQDDVLRKASKTAADAGVAATTHFVTEWRDPVDVIISVDAFEHFGDVKAVLSQMYELLRPGGQVFISFGPPWLHPLGGHLFSVFPWAHLIFTEATLIDWRSAFRDDGATRFSEVAGGLNQMTIARFERHIADSRFNLEKLELVPIRRLRMVACRPTREFTTAIVRATLRKPSTAETAARAARS